MDEYIEREVLDHAFLMLGYDEHDLPRRMLNQMPCIEVLSCPQDCIYKGKRHQKCSCCVRNRHMKDCYR